MLFNTKRVKEHQEFLGKINELSIKLKKVQDPQKVLIITNDKSLSDLLATVLSKEGYNISIANSLAEFETELLIGECVSYNILLLDVGLPNGDGLEWLEEVRTAGCITPVIVMTKYPSYERQKKAHELGVKSFVEKPIRIDRLLSRLREILDHV